MTIQDAFGIMLDKHGSQLDKAGVLYVLHPVGVVSILYQHNLSVTTDNEVIVALLHDVFEDTEYTFDQFIKEHSPNQDVLNALIAITKNKGEKYFDYVDRVKQNEIATKVKIADVIHNLGRLTPELKGLEKRYYKTLSILRGEYDESTIKK